MRDNLASILLLISGGIDSTALIDFYLRKNAKFTCLHFQYGQPSGKSEGIAVDRITKYYKVDVRIINLEPRTAQRGDEFLCRNGLFVLTSASLVKAPAQIAIGTHTGSRYYDCTPSFLTDCQRLLDGYFGGTVGVVAPFINLTKPDIIKYCNEREVPLQLTYSCVRQDEPPCGECASCKDRKKYYGH